MMKGIFFYDEVNQAVCSLTKYHEEELSIEPLVEAWPHVIYFYASLVPYEEPEIDHNTVVLRSGGGHIYHSFSPDCPPDCHGQTDGCLYHEERLYQKE